MRLVAATTPVTSVGDAAGAANGCGTRERGLNRRRSPRAQRSI
jgi:hypothetical protein